MRDFMRAKSMRINYEQLWYDLDRFDRGEQWDDASIPTWVPTPVTNYIHLTRTTRQASMALQNPTGQLRAISPNDQDKIDQLQKVYDYEFRKARVSTVLGECIGTAILLGTAIAQVSWNEETGVIGGTNQLYEGDIKVSEIDPSIFYPDPAAYRLEDCRFIHIVERKPIDWLKNHPKFKDAVANIPSDQFMTNIDGEVYSRIQNSQGKEGIIDFRQHWEKYKVIDNGEEVTRYRVTYLAGDTILQVLDPVVPNRYPFVVLYDYKQRREFWGKSTCAMILDNQKLINKVESIIALIGTQLQNPQRVVARNSGINPKEVAKFGGAPGKTWVSNGDPRNSIVNLDPPQIPPALFNLAQQAANNIREISGMNGIYMGEVSGSMRAASAIQALLDRAMLRDNYALRNIEHFVEDLTRIFIDFIAAYHTDRRYALVSSKQGNTLNKQEVIDYVGKEFQGINFDFFINASEEAPISRQRQQTEADKIINMQGQFGFDPPLITAQEYMMMSDFMDKDEILARMNQDETQSNIQLVQQILQSSIQALQNGNDPNQVMQFAQEAVQAKMQEKQSGTGSVNSSQFQQAQSAPQMG